MGVQRHKKNVKVGIVHGTAGEILGRALLVSFTTETADDKLRVA